MTLFATGLQVLPVQRMRLRVARTRTLSWPLSCGVQTAAYLASNPAVELLTLARAHGRAETSEQAVLEGAGEALLAGWTGTAYLVYYFLGAFVLLLLASLLKRTTAFPPSATWWVLAAGVLMLVPASFGLVGLVFAFVSLIPWSVFCVVVAVRMLRLADTGRPTSPQQRMSRSP